MTQFPVPREFRPPPGMLVVQVCTASRQLPGPRCQTKVSLAFDAASVPAQACTHHQPEPEPAQHAYEDEEDHEERRMEPRPRF